ncbi:unnamed protein product [Staurois parvus]|uniref:Secreted protein n=1 Tax=Staurois parvus TaxID=386267 RepID=A0ABN9BHE9_9NEOB|nr:unnamed protein product [Staurois parvus]
MCMARKFIFFFRRVHVISMGPISAVQTEGQGSCSLIGQSGENENSCYKALTSAQLDTDRSLMTTIYC